MRITFQAPRREVDSQVIVLAVAGESRHHSVLFADVTRSAVAHPAVIDGRVELPGAGREDVQSIIPGRDAASQR